MFTTLLAAIAIHAAPALPALHTSGIDLVQPDGTPVHLRRINLGGWLVEEMWMTPWQDTPPAASDLPKVKDHVSLWNVVEKRFGHDGMLHVRDAWRKNWITDADFGRIKDAGFDHVRIPFLDSLLAEPGGIAQLHKTVEMAAKHGLYTVLDMHGAPGGQISADHSGPRWIEIDFGSTSRTSTRWSRSGRR